MKYQNELIWLAQQIEKVTITEEPSLWRAIHLASSSSLSGNVESKRHVYITGDPQIVYKLTDLFESVSPLNEVVKLTSSKSNHPALQWMDITYIPPEHIGELPKNKTVTLFTENRLPLWSRQLFLDEKICNVVATEDLVSLTRMPKVCLYVIEDFSYEYLLDDVIVRKDEKVVKQKEELLPNVPKQYILQLNGSKEQTEQMLILDDIAVNMLNTYWLQNYPLFPQWMPILLREINVFLEMKQKALTKEQFIIELKVWGSRDKRINRA